MERGKTINIKLLSQIIQENFPEIAFAYLFGSAQDGVVRQGSDIDIAVYYNGTDLFIRAEVEKTVEKQVQLPADVVELQKTSNAVLAFEALKGKLLFVKEGKMNEYIGFYARTCRLYEDETYWMRKQLEYRGYEVQWSN